MTYLQLSDFFAQSDDARLKWDIVNELTDQDLAAFLGRLFYIRHVMENPTDFGIDRVRHTVPDMVNTVTRFLDDIKEIAESMGACNESIKNSMEDY